MMLLKDAHILIIDDDEDVLTALRLLLKSLVHKVVTNTNPNTINDLLSREKFDVVILDMNFNGLVNSKIQMENIIMGIRNQLLEDTRELLISLNEMYTL